MAKRLLRGVLAVGLAAVSGCESLKGSDNCETESPDGGMPPTYAGTLEALAGPLRENGVRERCSSFEGSYISEGTCADGKRFLSRNTGFVSETRYFDDDGRYVGHTSGSDVVDECTPYFHPSLAAEQCQDPQERPLCPRDAGAL